MMEKVEFEFWNGDHARPAWWAYKTDIPGLLVGKTPKLTHAWATTDTVQDAGPKAGAWSIFHKDSGLRLDTVPSKTRKVAIERTILAGTLGIDWTNALPAVQKQIRTMPAEKAPTLMTVRCG